MPRKVADGLASCNHGHGDRYAAGCESMRYWMRARAARAVALLFGMSLLLAACDGNSVREFLAELFPPPLEGEVALDGADDTSLQDASKDGESADEQDWINPNEHLGNLRSPPLREESGAHNDKAEDEQSEAANDRAADEATEQGDAANASEEKKQDRPTLRQPRQQAAAKAENSGPKDTGGRSGTLSSIEQEVFDLLNAARERAGVSPLRLDPELAQDARAWSRRMATDGFFQHDTSGDFAENIAYGYPSAAAVHDGWMSSDGHRDNRMNSRFTTYGVGIFEQGGTLYYTERFR